MVDLAPSIVATAIQFSGTVLVSVLLAALLRTVHRPFLAYWAAGWAAMSVALAILLLGFVQPAVQAAAFPVYCFAEYVAAYLWLGGCRAMTGGYRLHRRELFLCGPAAVAAVAVTLPFGTIDGVMVVHALVLASMFAIAAGAVSAGRKPEHGVGSGVMTAALVFLTADFLQYAPLCGYCIAIGRRDPFPHLKYSALYDLMGEMLLAFGMVLVVMEQVRQELLAVNRELQAAGVRLRRQAELDPLTGSLNRRTYETILEDAKVVGRSFAGCVAVLNVDNLKPINDNLGHSAGDRALQLVAEEARKIIRPDDLLFRWGGDEFLVIWLGHMKELDAAVRLEGLSEDVARAGRKLWSAGPTMGVSFGLAAFANASEVSAAVHWADQRMYARKLARPSRIRRPIGSRG